MNSKVRNKQKATRKRDGRVKITSQGQVSIPRQAMRDAGLGPGDLLQASVDDDGRIVLEPVREESLVLKVAGIGTGLFDRAEFEKLRDEWDRDYSTRGW